MTNLRIAIVVVAALLTTIVVLRSNPSLSVQVTSLQEHLAKNTSDRDLVARVASDARRASSIDAQALVGIWELPGRSGPLQTIEFRADGSFAQKEYLENGNVRVLYYNGKQDMFTGDASRPAYPSSATTTGLWSTVSDPSKELVSVHGNPPAPLSTLAEIPRGTLIKWNVGLLNLLRIDGHL